MGNPMYIKPHRAAIVKIFSPLLIIALTIEGIITYKIIRCCSENYDSYLSL